ncbi:MAG TPA: hypothetical protein VFQ91_22300 [Bryobacteraceae bacterium]|nr:hypothetical protein [Bryobacteraceae bacterium]
MPAVAWLAATLVFCLMAKAAEPSRQTPVYTGASIVNAATNEPGPLAPLALVSLYGKDLAVVTRAIAPDDLRNGQLPTTLIGTGVTVAIDNVTVPILFVSPNQINFLIPGNMRTGRRQLRVLTNGKAGPDVEILIAESSPGLFAQEQREVIATQADGTLITPQNPARPGEVLVFYAAGLGATSPAVTGLTIPNAAASITARSQFAVLLNGQPVADDNILYAGVTPGFAGLYQINCRLPDDTPENPEIRLRLPNQTSPPKVFISVRPAAVSLQ